MTVVWTREMANAQAPAMSWFVGSVIWYMDDIGWFAIQDGQRVPCEFVNQLVETLRQARREREEQP